jgi:hypothetical protein
VLTINGAYESTRRVHPIPERLVNEFVNDRGELITVVEGIEDIMDQAFSSRKLLSEMGVEWGVSTEPFSMEGYTEFRLPKDMDTCDTCGEG